MLQESEPHVPQVSRAVPETLDELHAHRQPLRTSTSRAARKFANRLEQLQYGRELGQIPHSVFKDRAQSLSADATKATEDGRNLSEGDHLRIQDNLKAQFQCFEAQHMQQVRQAEQVPATANGGALHAGIDGPSRLDVQTAIMGRRNQERANPTMGRTISPDQLLAMVNRPQATGWTLEAVVLNPDATPDVLRAVMSHTLVDGSLLAHIACHRNASDEVIIDAVNHRQANQVTLHAAALTPNASAEVLTSLMGHEFGNGSTLGHIAQAPNTTEAMIRAIMGHSRLDAKTLSGVAASSVTPPDVLVTAVNHQLATQATLWAAAYNPNANDNVHSAIRARPLAAGMVLPPADNSQSAPRMPTSAQGHSR